MPIVALSLKACRFDLKHFKGTAPRLHFSGAQPAVNTNLLIRGSPRVRCLALFDSGDGGGPHLPPNHTAYNDGWHPKGSWQTCWILLALTSAGALCWRDVTKHQSWAEYDSLPGKVSIIIPALNEEKCIAQTLQVVQSLHPPPHEVIVVDGGSTDRTKAIAASLGVHVLPCSPGRAKQMNAGAEAATGNLLCFLHADTHPPHELVSVVRGVMADPKKVLGGFRTIIQTDGRQLHGMTVHHLVKTYYVALLLRPLAFARGIRCLFGDQTLFCRATDFKTVGGFQNDLPIMEDVDLCIKLHEAGPSRSSVVEAFSHMSSKQQSGRITMVMSPVNCTSGRRLSNWGSVQATLIHFYIALRWYFGASPAQMYRIYHQWYTDNHR